TRVLVDGTTAPLSLWNDTQISGTIPGVTPGAKMIVIQRATGDGGLISSADFAFEVTVPSVTTVSPSSGPIGAAFTLAGQSFGPYAGTLTQVLIGGATAPLSLWNDGTITGTVPGGLMPGVQTVIVERRTSDGGLSRANTVYFEVTGLGLASLNPSTGPIGVPFAISGVGFGAYGGTNTRVKFGTTVAALSLWNDTTILGTVPPLSTGSWTVIVERQQGTSIVASNLSSFTVTALTPGSLTPTSGPIGAPFTLIGSGFGPYAGTNTRLLIGGATAALSVWNDTTISGTIPALPAGVQPLWLERVSGAGLQSSDTIYLTVVEPAIAAITPSSGPIGVAFTLMGAGFGPYNGTNTQVLI
ncbi:MAG: IPT/TIG domain-containing protein, partial [Elusimicrobiota bacterium]